jgi:7-carboxy-7-deazaguanine synthase
MSDRILISELFGPTIQGEGALIGRPTVFVRTGACDFRCAWCDTLYAVLPEFKGDWTPMTAEEILAKVLWLTGDKPILITLSGGNPALQPLEELIDLGHARGCTFALETQGSVAKSWFAKLDHLVLSP